MDKKNTNKILSKKDLSNSYPSGLNNVLKAKGGYEKRALIVLIVLLVIGVPLSIWEINSQIKSPFAPKKVSSVENINTTSNPTTQSPVIENLREVDTDQDGLSDYDELYRYETSPYIADSDSDKISDKLEVDQGTDPNCPEGTTCGRQEVTAIVNANEKLAGLENMSVEQLRQLMIDAGAPADEVNKIADDELLSTYQNILATEEGHTNTITDSQNSNLTNDNSNQAFNLENIDYETLLNLQPTEIRQLLVEGGVPKETLDQIDDETLKNIYLESLGQNYKELSQQ